MPSPNQRRNSGASTTRGTAFSILMYGSSTRARKGERARARPIETPSAAPASNPSSDSSSVTARCPQSVPLTVQRATRAAISVGRLTKNGSRTFTETSDCHAASSTMPSASCATNTTPRDGAPTRAAAALCTRRLRRPLALDHFFAQHHPDAAVQIDERRRRAQLHQIARPFEADVMLRNHPRRRAGGEDYDLVGERDRFFEIVGDEHDGFALARLPDRKSTRLNSSHLVISYAV